MARGDTAARQFRLLLKLLDSRELNVERAAEDLDCTTRTIYRDLEGLQRVGVPLYQETVGKQVRWKLDEDFNRKLSVQFTVQEAMALVAAEQLLAGMQGSMFDHAARNAVAKVKHELAPTIRKRLEALARFVTTTSAPTRKLGRHRAHLDSMIEAIEASEVVKLEYRKLEAKRAETYTVEPHHVHVQGTGVYLVGWARERKAVRIFLLDRVEEVRRLTETFERRPEIGPGLFAQGAFGLWDAPEEDIRLRFVGSAAQIVAEQEFHPTQRMSRGDDGSLVVEMRAPLSPSLKQWVRGFGERVEVLAPKALRS